MMERTYGRRKPGIPPRTPSNSLSDAVSQTEYLSSSSSPDIEPFDYPLVPFFSQESSSTYREDYPQHERREKRARNREAFAVTSTLLEAQEFGELMEHEDEVNFALDGLRKGQQVRIRRGSLSSLLAICASQHQRRSLRAQGISQSIIDAILNLTLDDIPSNLAAATLFFVLTADGQDEHFMESPKCIKFLIKLLKPVTVTSTQGKPPNIGFKLLSLLKDVDPARDAVKMNDPSASVILSRVQELLVNCKEIRSVDDNYKTETKRPELSTKWVALLTMERACLSKISFDDTSGSVKKTGGNFKEKLRELGGLDAVIEVIMDCHTVMERWMEYDALSFQDKKDNQHKQSLMLLLKCLKIMENATFLSIDNQNHLLGFKKCLGSHKSRVSFTELTLSVIKMLSGLHLRGGCSSPHKNNENPHCSNGGILGADRRVNVEVVTISSDTCSTVGSVSTRNGSLSQRGHTIIDLDSSPPSLSGSQSSVSGNDPATSTTRVGSTVSGSFAGRLASLGGDIARSTPRTSQVGEPSCKRNEKFSIPEENEDPFAFDLEDSEPSKWALVSTKQKKSRAQKKKGCHKQSKDERLYQPLSSQEESSNHRVNSQEESSDRDCSMSLQVSSSTNDIDEECLCLLSDCLLTAVKVLMNLTNDNAVGCRQVGGCRGLESMAELIARHFPFTESPLFSEMEETEPSHQKKDKHLTDQELDFLVAILGLLVNLVEKDGVNRSRLASASFAITKPEGLQESEQEMIPLLCSIFLTNQGSADTKEETTTFTLDDEEAVLESEKEAEKMIVEAYSALLLAFLSTESTSIRNSIKDYLPKRNLAILVPVLERFLAFHTTLNMIPPETHKAVMEVIESCKLP
ncbi:WAPL (Wings apart-like protein regulation of heterochromatin) protein [Raphanus sativus]|uniref:Wings apart-like protein 1 isoform X2 n=1 Tax=Raphanus sativus TaxID=3726 RepID=A0A6J0NL64_RAPSA|nr:wings apart-like protein 1 isoform X2 [Raphanus sativus]KAJ4895600.1 WAPL (Wings apart-like protein regulation of heterochromatin) protein [Raphanus sativus]